MRVALVHDWLTGMRGGERVLHQLALRFPDAPLYTLVHAPGSTTPAIEDRTITASPLDRIPGIATHYRKALPLFPWAIDRLRIADCDLVLSTSHAVAKCVRTPEGARHLAYCLTPMRYVWDQVDAYLGRGARRRLAAPLVERLRRFDAARSGPDHVDRFVAISTTVQTRIAAHYQRESTVVHPPVEVERFAPCAAGPEAFYLLVGGFVAYKREALVIEAFRRLGRPLVVVGDGPMRGTVLRDLPAHIEYRGRIPDVELADLYARCRALVYPQEEDFGIVAVEAQAAGRPVIAHAAGGALDTVVPALRVDAAGVSHATDACAPTGVHFEAQSVAGLVDAVTAFESVEARFDPVALRANAERFAPARFIAGLEAEIERTLGDRLPARDDAAPEPAPAGAPAWRRVEPIGPAAPRPAPARPSAPPR